MVSADRLNSATTIPIAAAVNSSYALPLAVLLTSIRQTLHPAFHPVLYLIHSGLPAATLNALSSIVETHLVVPPDDLFSTMPSDSRYPRETAIPLLLADILPPDIDRVLFIDADMLALDDISPLWQTPLNGATIGACPDLAVPLCSGPRGIEEWRQLGIPEAHPYLNGGLLLIDLHRWREKQITPQVLDYMARSTRPPTFLHQEAMNAILWNDWTSLDPRWNLLGSKSGRPFEHPQSEAWRRPGIVHFAGRMKPWRIPIGGPFYQPYRQVLQQVLPLFPRQTAAPLEHAFSLYDRHLRNALFPVEQFLWRQRLL